MAQFNIACYLEKAFYNNISIGEDKFYTFATGPAVKYRSVTQDSASVAFKVAVQGNFKLIRPKSINVMASAPMLVLLEVDPQAVTPFSLLQEALEDSMQCVLNSGIGNLKYLNADLKVFHQLEILNADEASPELVFTITLRHILMRDGAPRMKFVLAAVDTRSPKRKRAASKKPLLKVPKLSGDSLEKQDDDISLAEKSQVSVHKKPLLKKPKASVNIENQDSGVVLNETEQVMTQALGSLDDFRDA